MTGYPNSHLVPFLDSTSAPSMLILRDNDFVENSQLLDCPNNFVFDGLPSYPEVPPRGIVLTSNHHKPNPKVPISRTNTPTSWSNRSRVSQACKACRELKTKCSGHRPACHRCKDLGLDCNYSERKRELINKRMEDLGAHVEMLENLLRDVYPKLDTNSAQHIDQTLKKVLSHDRARLTLPPLAETCNAPDAPRFTIGYTNEDFNRNGELQALGFVGEHSEMAWLYRIKSALEQVSATSSPAQDGLSQSSIASIDYYSNDSKMDVREEINVFERPEKTEADQLINTYFRIIHPSFPIVGKTTLLGQYRSLYTDSTARPGKQWLAVMNFMFAIAAMHLSPTQEIAECDEAPHRVFFSRGWILSMDKASLRDHACLQQVQVEGLAAFYLLASGQVNRSWKCGGIAICSALAMGLNLRSESQSVAPLSKEIRYRVWWALYVLDTSLAEITGRPPRMSEAFCTTPLPMPFEEGDLHNQLVQKDFDDKVARSRSSFNLLDNMRRNAPTNDQNEDGPPGRLAPRKRSLNKDENVTLAVSESPQPSDSLCFSYSVSLTMLIREAINTLYAPGTANKQWVDVAIAIASLNVKANTWLASLPASYQFQRISVTGPLRHQLSRLAFQFYFTKLLITQPCLRRLMYSSEEVSDASEDVFDPMASICIQATGQLLDLLPDEPNLTWLYGVVPWWCALHYLMQAIAIILTESFLRANAGTVDTIGISQKLTKATAWVKELSKVDISARKAFLICSDIISRQVS
ncbi:hypothetical protein N7499_012208 [Penicillium canescens]|uniref:Zn(2)-C6 fungal-type domain-containing protein n=1 Tax=Penicillium canescens TaxID=5083 RepID=A0AAD6N4U7_PENCN|nr:uncharacterized protein N7446_001144 [Penicillium canescens]KAJ6029800.1 hypothetical protein N7460_010066 [Penicillium canescens]KAJ6060173.1 hypothetical protein N7444_002027 [Penicillium canescens]KAJ6063528.1 hypothetical protein N7499_012208 [Penicillium canescens]KAJ6078208.1 hypothetical protein N7446_001144 [Penicillium canescens]KAJ6154974.1 hypothetical protein N7485_013343 [Penicillium canescens]